MSNKKHMLMMTIYFIAGNILLVGIDFIPAYTYKNIQNIIIAAIIIGLTVLYFLLLHHYKKTSTAIKLFDALYPLLLSGLFLVLSAIYFTKKPSAVINERYIFVLIVCISTFYLCGFYHLSVLLQQRFSSAKTLKSGGNQIYKYVRYIPFAITVIMYLTAIINLFYPFVSFMLQKLFIPASVF